MTRGAAESRRDAHAKLQLANQQAAGRRFKYLMQQSGLGDFFRDGFFERPVEEPSLRVEPLNVGDKRRKNSVDEKITDEPDTIEFLTKQPSVIQGTMRPYQLAGLNWMIRLRHNGLNGILADEMGLGKTLQTLALLDVLMRQGSNSRPLVRKVLILTPVSVVGSWESEFDKWGLDNSITVLACGGGAPCIPEIRNLMHSSGACVVYLHAGVDALVARRERQDQDRPALFGAGGLREEVVRTYAERDAIFRDLARHIVEVDVQQPSDSLTSLTTIFKEECLGDEPTT